MAKKKKVKLWERQPWDTQGSFTNFHTYYLSQVGARSLDKAFRECRLQTGDKPSTQKRASKAWRNWYQGKNYSGKEIAGAVGWARRAKAFDDFCAKNNINQWIARREKVRQDDWILGEEMRELATAILAAGPGFLKRRKRTVKGKDGKPDKVYITLALDVNAAVKAGKLGSDLMRLAAGMETGNIKGELDITEHVKIFLPENDRGDRKVDNDE